MENISSSRHSWPRGSRPVRRHVFAESGFTCHASRAAAVLGPLHPEPCAVILPLPLYRQRRSRHHRCRRWWWPGAGAGMVAPRCVGGRGRVCSPDRATGEPGTVEVLELEQQLLLWGRESRTHASMAVGLWPPPPHTMLEYEQAAARPRWRGMSSSCTRTTVGAHGLSSQLP